MLDRLPDVLVRRRVDLTTDRANIIWTFTPQALSALLSNAGVDRTGDLPMEVINRLCFWSGSRLALGNMIQRATNSIPALEYAGIVVQTSVAASPATAPELDKVMAAGRSSLYAYLNSACDPQRHTVDFDLQVFTSAEMPPDDRSWQELGRTLLRGTLFPGPGHLT